MDKKPFKVRPIRSGQGARKLLSRIIYQLQINQISADKAKTLCYLLNSYAAMFNNEKQKKEVVDGKSPQEN